MDMIALYRGMARSRAFEFVQAELWRKGLISGEMHQGTGEEAVVAGVVAHLRKGDAVSLDHRPSAAMLLLGVPAIAMIREMLGRADGLCGGSGGHMHLFSPEHLVASSGIVGASAPIAAGFALAAKRLRPSALAVALFGDGAANQGMVLEAWNLAAVWSLPVLFVCKVNGWAITTRTAATTGGDLVERARGLGLEAERVDGCDVRAVHAVAGRLVERTRRQRSPSFLAATCLRLDGHILGDPLLAMGMLAGIPGLTVVVPSTPTDAAGLMMAPLAHDGPVIYLEPKLLSDWLDFLGRCGRDTVTFEVPSEGAEGDVPDDAPPIPFGSAAIRRSGSALTIVSLAVGVHRALAAAHRLSDQGISCEVIDLRSVRPLDARTVIESVRRTGRLLVVDEDYREFGLSGELAAVVLEAGAAPYFGRVCLEGTLPYDRRREAAALPNVERIVAAARALHPDGRGSVEG